MTIDHPSEFQERYEQAYPFQIHVTSYRIDGEYYCSVDNVDPGAVIARSKAATREEAEQKAIARAKGKLENTRIKSS